MLGIQWEDGEYECHNSISQDTARSIAAWARDRGLPFLEQIEFNGWPHFTPETLDQLIAEFEQVREWLAALYPDGWNSANAFLPRLRQLREEQGWREGDFG